MSQISTYLKQELNETVNETFASLKNKVSGNILNYELGILYSNKIYAQDAEIIQKKTSILAEEIDHILNENRDNCLREIERAVDKINGGAERV